MKIKVKATPKPRNPLVAAASGLRGLGVAFTLIFMVSPFSP